MVPRLLYRGYVTMVQTGGLEPAVRGTKAMYRNANGLLRRRLHRRDGPPSERASESGVAGTGFSRRFLTVIFCLPSDPSRL
jgi:hypothetical protein